MDAIASMQHRIGAHLAGSVAGAPNPLPTGPPGVDAVDGLQLPTLTDIQTARTLAGTLAAAANTNSDKAWRELRKEVVTGAL